jgi:hypothetical protein
MDSLDKHRIELQFIKTLENEFEVKAYSRYCSKLERIALLKDLSLVISLVSSVFAAVESLLKILL